MTTAESLRHNILDEKAHLKATLLATLERDRVVILPPLDVVESLNLFELFNVTADVAMIDPWYNKGVGGIQDDYLNFFLDVIRRSSTISSHVFFWGFPEIVAPFVERIPAPLRLVCWLTWYYKNNPSVIRGWRSSQNACLHMFHENVPLFPERFLNQKQLELRKNGKLRYMPGPTSVLESCADDVIEQPLLVGFVGKQEQTGHPSQKPFKVYDQILKMTVPDNGVIIDPMAGSGTVGAVALERGFKAILCDNSNEYTKIMEKRLGVKRWSVKRKIKNILRG
jgi:site-specific DNA-methyltransferase (adenine-specific)